MTTSSLAFTKLVVQDLARSERFYREVFGLKPFRRLTDNAHAFALEEVMLSTGGEAGGHVLVLTRYLKRPCPPAGAAWTGFIVADLDSTVSATERCEGKVAVAIHENVEHGVRAALLEDPEGHMIEAIQHL